jgi:hypothetical protein
VKPLGDQFFSCTPFANDEHRAIEGCGAARPFDAVEEGGRFADKLNITIHAQHLALLTNI